jgi:broad specificity polyphosphatase/5'/3'-nucleotidase SurE
MITRRLAINFPLQAQVLQRIKINEVAVVDFWQKFLRKQYNKTPYWMYTKGIKKAKEKKEKVTNIKESSIKDFSTCMGYDIKTVKEALEFFPDEMKRELHEFEKMIL